MIDYLQMAQDAQRCLQALGVDICILNNLFQR